MKISLRYVEKGDFIGLKKLEANYDDERLIVSFSKEMIVYARLHAFPDKLSL
jgi:hypothetical protein